MSNPDVIRVAADYDCHATWRVAADGLLENLPPSQLALTPHLQSALERWAAAYTTTLNRDDPMSSGFLTNAEREFHCAWGRALARLLAGELGESVEYFDNESDSYSVVPSHPTRPRMAMNVQFPSMRRDVMFALATLADRGYQESVWLGRRPRAGYEDDLAAAVHVLYDDCQVLPDPISRLGSVLVEGDELDRLRRVDAVLSLLLAAHPRDDDQAFLDDPRWRDVAEAAGMALFAMVISGGLVDV